jgi:hypothetical protein
MAFSSTLNFSISSPTLVALETKPYKNEPLGAKGPPLVGEEVWKEDVGKVES